MEPISARYRDTILRLVKHARNEMEITPDNVIQDGNRDLLPFIDSIIEDNLAPDSEIRAFANLEHLSLLAKGGKSCLLLLEHYSNFDLPVLSYLLRKRGELGARIADDIVAIAGIKLSETDPVVTAFTEAYSRLVIYPSRYLEIIQRNITDPKELVSEVMKANAINRAAMKALGELRDRGKLVLVFPSGTRYRPWEPSTKRGVREIDSYLKTFDVACLVSINGNILRVNPEGEMKEDLIARDRVVFDVSPPLPCDELRKKAKRAKHFGDDKKQAIVDYVMASLEAMHQDVERQDAEHPASDLD